LEPVSLMIKKSRLRWFGHVERKDDNDLVKRCMTWEVEGIRQRGRLKKAWWDYVKYGSMFYGTLSLCYCIHLDFMFLLITLVYCDLSCLCMTCIIESYLVGA